MKLGAMNRVINTDLRLLRNELNNLKKIRESIPDKSCEFFIQVDNTLGELEENLNATIQNYKVLKETTEFSSISIKPDLSILDIRLILMDLPQQKHLFWIHYRDRESFKDYIIELDLYMRDFFEHISDASMFGKLYNLQKLCSNCSKYANRMQLSFDNCILVFLLRKSHPQRKRRESK